MPTYQLRIMLRSVDGRDATTFETSTITAPEPEAAIRQAMQWITPSGMLANVFVLTESGGSVIWTLRRGTFDDSGETISE